ncbi:hypothetical protein BKA08_003786 [Nocardioides marinisabuli]|uniref:Uncharacterized protein n=1 Tax=Nocardioides marinisabuli TaxID=419476 RepID=A0A7Y9F4L9_9ACTN|nr:hypothetical protein [Nocardioides marinisabuli]
MRESELQSQPLGLAIVEVDPDQGHVLVGAHASNAPRPEGAVQNSGPFDQPRGRLDAEVWMIPLGHGQSMSHQPGACDRSCPVARPQRRSLMPPTARGRADEREALVGDLPACASGCSATSGHSCRCRRGDPESHALPALQRSLRRSGVWVTGAGSIACRELRVYRRSSVRNLVANGGQCRRGLGRSNSFHVHTVNPEPPMSDSTARITSVRYCSVMARVVKPIAKAMQSADSDAGNKQNPNFARHSASRRLLKLSTPALPKPR